MRSTALDEALLEIVIVLGRLLGNKNVKEIDDLHLSLATSRVHLSNKKWLKYAFLGGQDDFGQAYDNNSILLQALTEHLQLVGSRGHDRSRGGFACLIVTNNALL